MHNDTSPRIIPPQKPPGTVPETWRYRSWCAQAATLYPRDPQRQRQAVLAHLGIKMHLTASPAQWLWCESLASALHEVAP